MTDAQDADNQMQAGFYLRAQRQIRSWSWRLSRREPAILKESETAHPWAGLAEWLRAAHSLLDEKAAK